MAFYLVWAWALAMEPEWAQKQPLEAQTLNHPASNHAVGVTLWGDATQLWMSWLEPKAPGGTRLLLARYEKGNWGPARVVTQNPAILANWADFPRFAIEGKHIAIGWPERPDLQAGRYGLKIAWSADHGITWSTPRYLHDNQEGVEYGFLSLAPLGNERFAAIWLDGRTLLSEESHESHGHSGHMQLRGRVIGQHELGPEWMIDDATCECCQTDLAVSGSQWLIAYRNLATDSTRDITLWRGSPDHEAQWAPVANDGWKIQGCPVNGPALDLSDRSLAVTWFSAKTTPTVSVVTSRDEGKTFSAPLVLRTETLGRLDAVYLTPDTLVVSWLGSISGKSQLELGVLHWNKTGERLVGKAVVGPVDTEHSSGFPRLARYGQYLVVAYQAPGKELSLVIISSKTLTQNVPLLAE